MKCYIQHVVYVIKQSVSPKMFTNERLFTILAFTITLESGIDVGPTLINFGFFSRPYGLIREYIEVI